MIATGNHDFERFAALCNTPEVEPRVLRTMCTVRQYDCLNGYAA